MAQINALDLGYVGEAVKHFNPEFVRGCLGVKSSKSHNETVGNPPS